jgi:hypothetical protein
MKRTLIIVLLLVAQLAPATAGAAPLHQAPTIPVIEEIPPLLQPVVFVVPQCNACTPDGSTLLPYRPWSDSWPAGWETLNLAVVFQTVISWLAWQVSELWRLLICWLLSMLQMLANFLAVVANLVVAGLNGLWRLLIWLWLNAKAIFLAGWNLFEEIRAALAVGIDLSWLAAWLQLIIDLILLALDLIGQVSQMALQLFLVLIGLISWVGGLALILTGSILGALSGTTVPVQIEGTHPVYYMVRGSLDALFDSQVAWLVYLTVAFIYGAFFTWFARFIGAGANSE